MSYSIQKHDNNSIKESPSRFELYPNYSFNAENPAKESLDPKKIISVLLRFKWLVLLFLVAGAAGAWFYADNITPTYESKGILLITTSGAYSDNELSRIISQTTGFGTSSTLENELQVLSSREFSRSLARTVIENDSGDFKVFPILWEKEENGEVYRAGEETVAARIRSNLSFRLPEKESDVVEISFRSPSSLEAAIIVNEAMEKYVENSTHQNRQAAQSTAEFLEKEKEDIKQKLEISEERLRNFMDNSGIVRVDEQATGVITQRTNAEVELQRINLELETIEQAIANHEKQLERTKPGLLEQFAEAIGPRIRNSQEDLARFESERTLIITKNPGVLKREPIPPRLKFVDEQIERLKKEIKLLSDQLFTEDDEYMGMDNEDRAEMVTGIQRRLVELRIEQNLYRSRRDALVQHKKEMDASFNSLPEGMIELAKLQRDVTINEELYLNVSKQYADMSVWKQSQFGFGRIIDTADIANVPVSPNKKMFILLGVMLGGLFAAGLIAFYDFKDNSVKSVDQLRTIYLPALTLSVIPAFDKVPKKNRKFFATGNGRIPDELVLLQDRASLPSESIRRLKNHLIYHHGDKPPKTIAVTSPEKGDGKSTIVANLGIAFAEEGYRTLVIGADFRRPQLGKYFGLSGKNGLTSYLAGHITIQQLLQSTDLNNLKVVAAGEVPLNPETIVSSRPFKEFLNSMKEIFDVIILDTPPFGIISDSAALMKESEAVLVVVGYKKTNQGMLLRTIEELEKIHANVTGIVLNNFDHRKETGNYYGAGYYQSLYSNYDAYVR